MLQPVDGELLERLCVALAMARSAMDYVIDLGLIIKSPDKGVPIQNPCLPVVNRQTEIARKLASKLGLPVTARSRIDAPDAPLHSDDEPEKGGDDLEKFLAMHPDRRPN